MPSQASVCYWCNFRTLKQFCAFTSYKSTLRNVSFGNNIEMNVLFYVSFFRTYFSSPKGWISWTLIRNKKKNLHSSKNKSELPGHFDLPKNDSFYSFLMLHMKKNVKLTNVSARFSDAHTSLPVLLCKVVKKKKKILGSICFLSSWKSGGKVGYYTHFTRCFFARPGCKVQNPKTEAKIRLLKV